MITHPGASACYLLQQAAAAGRQIFAVGLCKIAQKKWDVFIPGDRPEGGQVNPAGPVGIAGMPAGQFHVVIAGVGAVPSKHYIAKAVALL